MRYPLRSRTPISGMKNLGLYVPPNAVRPRPAPPPPRTPRAPASPAPIRNRPSQLSLVFPPSRPAIPIRRRVVTPPSSLAESRGCEESLHPRASHRPPGHRRGERRPPPRGGVQPPRAQTRPLVRVQPGAPRRHLPHGDDVHEAQGWPRRGIHRRVLLASRIQIARRTRTIEFGTRRRSAQGDRGTQVIPTERSGTVRRGAEGRGATVVGENDDL